MKVSLANNSSPLRLLHYLDEVREEAGGVVRSVIDICSAVAARGIDVTLATFDPRDIPPSWKEETRVPRVVCLDRDNPQVDTLLRECDVVHLHTPWDRFNLRVARLCRHRGIPYIITPHGMLDDWSMAQKALKKRVYWQLAARRLLEGAWRVHCTAEGEAQQTRKWHPRRDSVVQPLVVEKPDECALPGPGEAQEAFGFLGADRPTLLFLSRLHPKKGVELLLEATRQVTNLLPGVQLVIAGPGEAAYVDSLRALAHKLEIAPWTHFVGMVQGSLKFSLYDACQLFVLPTQQENFGLVLPEAMLCGTPVVTTKGVDIWPEIISAGGRVVERNSTAFATTIVELLADPIALAELGKRCQQATRQWLAPDRVTAGYLDLYYSAVGIDV